MIETLDLIDEIGPAKAVEVFALCLREADDIPDITISGLGDEVPVDWARMVKKSSNEVFRIEAQTRAQMIRLLATTRKEVWKKISSVPPGQWTAEWSGALIGEIDSMMDELAKGMDGVTFDGATKIADKSVMGIDAIITSGLEKELLLPQLTPQLVQAAATFWQDEYVSMTASAKARINSIIRTAVLTGESPYATAQLIAPKLTTPSIFKSLGHRAEAIARTETMRVQSMAAQMRITQAAEVSDRIRKTWVSVLDPKRTRKSHVRAHNRYIPGGWEGPIKHDANFLINGSPMSFPRDPKGPVGEIVHCMCALSAVVVSERKAKGKK